MNKYTEHVDKIIRFCEMLTVPDGHMAGQRVKLSGEQIKFIESVYGPRTPDGKRIVREALLSMGRKNAKTATIAMLALIHICGPEATLNAEIYSVAFEKEQAAQVFRYAAAMIYANEYLTVRLNVLESQKMIKDPVSGSMYKALSRESKGKLGKSTSVFIFDEGAQYGQDRRLLDAMITSMGAHESPLSFFISTQAANDAAWFSEMVDKAKQINSGELVDPEFVGFVYETPPDADPFDEKSWYLSNPHLGTFKSLEYMRRMARKAQESPSFLNSFLNLELNQRIAAESPFIPLAIWNKNSEPPDLDLFESGRPCWVGLDLSAKNDLTALIFVCVDDNHQWHVLPQFFVPQEGIADRSRRDRVPYDLWAKQGFLTATPGPIIDYEYVANILKNCYFNVQALRFDRWHIEHFTQELRRAGVPCWIEGKEEPRDGLRLVQHGQGSKDFAPAVDRLEDLLLEGRIRHGNHPVLTMCASNARVTKDTAGNRKLDKIESTGRIDGMVALAMALNWTKDFESVVSVYEDRGPIVISMGA